MSGNKEAIEREAFNPNSLTTELELLGHLPQRPPGLLDKPDGLTLECLIGGASFRSDTSSPQSRALGVHQTGAGSDAF